MALQGVPQGMGAALGFTFLCSSTALRVAILGYPRMYFVFAQGLEECCPKSSVTAPVTPKYLGTLPRLGMSFFYLLLLRPAKI